MNSVRAASIQRQARRLRGLGQVRGLGQSASITSQTSCATWTVLPQGDPAWAPIMAAIVAGGFSTPQLVNGDWHFTYNGPIPAGSMISGGGGPILMKVNAIAGANPNAATIEFCGGAMMATGVPAAASSSMTPYIVAGVLGVLLLGGLLMAED